MQKNKNKKTKKNKYKGRLERRMSSCCFSSSSSSSSSYIGNEIEKDRGSIGRHILQGGSASSADHDLRTVGQSLVGGVPAAVLQGSGGLYPVAIAICCARTESSNLQAPNTSSIKHKNMCWSCLLEPKSFSPMHGSWIKREMPERELACTLEKPSLSPPVCTSVPSAANCPEEHQVSVCMKRGRMLPETGSKMAECAVQSTVEVCVHMHRERERDDPWAIERVSRLPTTR